jgi:hypothetical protein
VARGTSFLTLLDMLRDEVGVSTNVGLGIDDLSKMKRHINRAYALVYDEKDWPHLRKVVPRSALNAGQRLYDFPATVNYERVESIVAYIGSMPYDLQKGITSKEYAIIDSEEDERADPAQRWDLRWSGTAPQIEIWPMPVSSSQTLEIIGTAAISRLVDDDDICVLDDELVVLHAAARILARSDSKDAKVAAAELGKRMSQMKARSSPASRTVMGGGSQVYPNNRVHLTISGS